MRACRPKAIRSEMQNATQAKPRGLVSDRLAVLQQTANSNACANVLKQFQSVANGSASAMQLKALAANKLNVCGETHDESIPERNYEREYATEKTGGIYKTESSFTVAADIFAPTRFGDPSMLRAEMQLATLKQHLISELGMISIGLIPNDPMFANANGDKSLAWAAIRVPIKRLLGYAMNEIDNAENAKADKAEGANAKDARKSIEALHGFVDVATADDLDAVEAIFNKAVASFASEVLGLDDIRDEAVVSRARSAAMHGAAKDNANRNLNKKKGVWKVGDDHIAEIKQDQAAAELDSAGSADYEVLTKAEFLADYNPWKAQKGY